MTRGDSMRRFAAVAVLFLLGLSAQSMAAPPAVTPAQTGPPNSVAVTGDSISAATGTSGIPGSEQPANSWGTGTSGSVLSVYQRLLAVNPAAAGKNYNLSSNGKRMNDLANQANAAPLDTELILIQMGGNDLCRSTVAEMTPLATYRTQFSSGLDAIAERIPNARIMVSSVPDIYNLWFLRGAPSPPNDQPSSNAGVARTFWGLGIVPCQSLVTAPTDMSQAAIERRNAVRTQNIALNQILAEECATRLRCRFDDNATFNFSSNRISPPFGDYLPRADWGFLDADISTIDHFHPSISGQNKLARASWESGYNYADTTAPVRSAATISPTPIAGGTNPTVPNVNISYTDAGGIKGIQYRLRTAAPAGPWTTSLTSSISVPVNTTGISYLESRALDRNGNMSASSMGEVNYDPTIVPVPVVSQPSTTPAQTNPSFTFSGVTGLTFECSVDGGSFAACTSPRTPTGSTEGQHTFTVRQVGTTGTRSQGVQRTWTVDTTPPGLPSITGAPAAVTIDTGASISFSGEAQATFECSVDAGSFNSCGSPINLSELPDGPHSVAVRQTDVAGNTSDAATAKWNVDTTAPAAPRITKAPPVLVVYKTRSHSITFSGEPGGSFECRTDGGAWQTCSSPAAVTFSGDGLRTFEVRQTDAVGNTGPSESTSLEIDTVAPAAPRIEAAPSGIVRSTSATVSIMGEATSTILECRLNSGAWANCSTPWQLDGLPQGIQLVEVRETDRAGNKSAVSSATWTVDTIAPRLKGKPKAKRKGRKTVLTTRHVASFGKPANLEFSSAKKKPRAGAVAKPALTKKWAAKLTLRSPRKITWVRVSDAVGNQSGWVKVG